VNHTSSHAITARIAQRLAGEVGQQRFNMWFDRSARMNYHGDTQQLRVAVPNRVVADWIDRNFREQLTRAAADESGEQVAISLYVEPGAFGAEFAATSQAAAAAMTAPKSDAIASTGNSKRSKHAPARTASQSFQSSSQSSKNSVPRSSAADDRQIRYSLDDFVVGPSNELAFSAAHQLVEHEHGAVNPLFIHGGVGLGKTHLLQGICQLFRERKPDARILYTTGEKFTNEYLASMANRTQEQFRQKIRRLDLLAIDDVHFLAGKEKTQQEFLHSFDEIDLGGARVVMASDNAPKQIKQFSAALVSRCIRGLVVEVRSPDTPTRIRIVKALAQRKGLTLLESVLAVLASRCQGSVREIEGTLAKLHALANLTDGRLQSPPTAPLFEQQEDATMPVGNTAPIGHALVNRLLSGEQSPVKKRINFERILEVVCDQLHVTKAQVLGSQRVKQIVLARSLVIFLTRQLTTMSYPEISSAINKNSHSTIIAADRRITEQLTDDTPLMTQGSMDTDMIPLSELVERIKQEILRG